MLKFLRSLFGIKTYKSVGWVNTYRTKTGHIITGSYPKQTEDAAYSCRSAAPKSEFVKTVELFTTE